MKSLVFVLIYTLGLFNVVLVAWVVLSWLLAFEVVNRRNSFVQAVARGLDAVTEPVLRPIRRYMPNLGGIDISPIILFLIIIFLQDVLARYVMPVVP